jgi:predicted MPP superfamily phosphohydrolase
MPLSRRRALRILAAGGAGALGLATYGFGVERRRITTTRETVPLPGLPPALDGLRIGLLTDLHYGSLTGAEIVSAAGNRLREEGPDLIVLAGDYVTSMDRESVPGCADALGELRAPLGVFAVLGNHDPESVVRAVFTVKGITVLRDEHVELKVRDERIALGGLRYWSRSRSDVERAFRGGRGFPILVAHDPRRVRLARAAEIPLVLSGHTHGGQIYVPGVGARGSGRFPVLQGLAREGQTSLFVSRGVGTVVLPVRFGCPPEVAILTLATARG